MCALSVLCLVCVCFVSNMSRVCVCVCASSVLGLVHVCFVSIMSCACVLRQYYVLCVCASLT